MQQLKVYNKDILNKELDEWIKHIKEHPKLFDVPVNKQYPSVIHDATFAIEP